MVREKVVNSLSLFAGYLSTFFVASFLFLAFLGTWEGGVFYKYMYLSALFTFLLTSFYFSGIVLPQILQPCLLDACFVFSYSFIIHHHFASRDKTAEPVS